MFTDYNRLRLFKAIYECKGIQAAADMSHISRSAVSQSLRHLEQELGVQLFIRTSKLFKATAVGEEFYQKVTPLLEAIDDVTSEIQGQPKVLRGRILLASLFEIGRTRLVDAVNEFHHIHPEVSFNILSTSPPNMVQMLVRGEIHYAFIDQGDLFTKNTPVLKQKVWQEQFVMAGAPSLLKVYPHSDYDEISRLPIIDYVSYSPAAKRWFKYHYRKVPRELNNLLSIQDVQGVIRACEAGLGVGVIPLHLVTKKLRIIAGPKGDLQNPIYLTHVPGPIHTETSKAFLKFIKGSYKVPGPVCGR